MEYRLLGRSGVRVSAISLGTVYFGTQVPADAAGEIVRAALDRGVNFLDTAEIYMRPGYGAAEEVLGRALAGRRHEVVLATKKRRDPDQFRSGTPRDHGLSRHQIVEAVEGSLRRLRTDYVDVYYPHSVDPEVDLEVTLRAFDDLLRAGKVRAIGLSNFPAWLTVEALWIADRRGFAPPVCVQTLYNLLDRSAERELAPACQRHSLSLVAYSPLGGGVLTGKYRPDAPVPPDSRAAQVGHRPSGRPGHIPVLDPAYLAAAERLGAVARELGATAGQAAIAWVLRQPAVASVIVGASSVAQLDQNLTALDLRLDAEAEARLAAAMV
ncbi:MAG TPA: aldo/keto reductase [Chloroflexota bacterium]|nr:aldo/keto reductase [Chloroflexota bacterium]